MADKTTRYHITATINFLEIDGFHFNGLLKSDGNYGGTLEYNGDDKDFFEENLESTDQIISYEE